MDLMALLGAIAIVGAIPAIVLICGRLVGGGESLDAASFFPHPWEPEWPRGVQEEEPVRLRIEPARPERAALVERPSASQPNENPRRLTWHGTLPER